MAETLHTRRDGRVLYVTLDNPPRHFMNWQMVVDLEEVVNGVQGDRSIGVVVITGPVDDVFLNHYDLEEILESSGDGGPSLSYAPARIGLKLLETIARVRPAADAILETPAAGGVAVRRIHDLFLRMNRMDKVFIAALNGNALAGGCELALACDVRIMVDGMRMALPEVTLGVIPGFGGTQRLARMIGESRALEAMLDARDFEAEEARAIGLVHTVVQREQFEEEVRTTAERLARRPAAAVWAVKRAVYDGGTRNLPQGLAFERAVFAVAASSKAARRGASAMLEEIRAGGGAGPGAQREDLLPWRDGTVVDMTAD
jgi:enoyl-CoA hydratase